jgi:hypothetical protein
VHGSVALRGDNGPCAVAALDAWLAILEQKKGPLFLRRARSCATCG